MASNGKEGLDKAYEYKPDLIISDIMMPEMSGTEMCLKIKNNIDLCHIPIILLTALNSVEQNIEALIEERMITSRSLLIRESYLQEQITWFEIDC